MEPADLDRRRKLIDTLAELSTVQTVDQLVTALRGSARAIAKADGITIVRRDGNHIVFLAEDAGLPDWVGQAYPLEQTICGLAMLENRPIQVPYLLEDPRIPPHVFDGTFVQAMAAFPIGVGAPQMSMGAYWHVAGPIDPQAVSLLASLARAASVTFERVMLAQNASSTGVSY